MPSTKKAWKSGSGRRARTYAACSSALLLLIASYSLVLSGAPSDEARISIYSPVANYSLTVLQRAGREYVGLLEILEPLGQVSARTEKQSLKLRFNSIDAQLGIGTNRVRVRGHDLELTAPLLMENGRGLVPVDSLVTLLPQFLGIPVTYHPASRRLFVNQNGTTYSTQFNNGNPPKLILSFTSPVNPMIATEPGKLRMTFARDPLVASGPATMNFDARAIASATFEENNGAAAITITGSAPLMASFGNDGRMITIAPAPARAAPQTTAAPPSPPASASATNPAPLATPLPPAGASPSPPQARAFAVIDASHGGSEPGATLSDKLFEKDVTLAFARRIRQELAGKGLSAALLRDSDAVLTTDQRAGLANAMHPAIYLCIHAAADGKGTRIYTAMFSAGEHSVGPFLPWNEAQMSSLGMSQAVATSMTTELGRTFPARILTASLHPLQNVTAPAVALEIAPRNGHVEDLESDEYQQQVGVAVANALVSLKDKLGGPQ